MVWFGVIINPHSNYASKARNEEDDKRYEYITIHLPVVLLKCSSTHH